MKKIARLMLSAVLSVVSGILWVLSLPKVRNFIWNKVVGKSREKVIDVKARVVSGSSTGTAGPGSGTAAGGDEGEVKKKGGILG